MATASSSFSGESDPDPGAIVPGSVRVQAAHADRFQRLVLTEVIAAQTLGDFGLGDPHETTRAVLSPCNGVADWFRTEGAATPEQIADRYVDFALRLVLDRGTVSAQT